MEAAHTCNVPEFHTRLFSWGERKPQCCNLSLLYETLSTQSLEEDGNVSTYCRELFPYNQSTTLYPLTFAFKSGPLPSRSLEA